ncbi:MAG: hypothetical protein LAQ69_09580 [Acidobacteriia bacterium]|nr:hypothetical protein [Terriglobia bacterium]
MAEPLSPSEIARHTGILNESRDTDQLVASALALAASEDPPALLALGRVLRHGEFLNRLDDTANPSSEIRNVARVFGALADHPTPATGRLCELIYVEPEFSEIPSRINLLLAALAAVHPVTPRGADIFRETSQDEYAEVNAPLLLKNESPLALQVFDELISGDWVEDYVKVDMLHRSVLPRRTRLPVLEVCALLLERGLPPEVRDAIIETVFDYDSRLWFGPAMYPPEPPAWHTATTEALEFLVGLATRLQSGNLSGALQEPVQATREEVQNILQSRPR